MANKIRTRGVLARFAARALCVLSGHRVRATLLVGGTEAERFVFILSHAEAGCARCGAVFLCEITEWGAAILSAPRRWTFGRW